MPDQIKVTNHMITFPERYGMMICKACQNYYQKKSACKECNGIGLRKTPQRKRLESLNNNELTQNETEAVKLKATSHTWQCPKCSYVQGEPFAYDAVICNRCKTLYEVTEHEHKLD